MVIELQKNLDRLQTAIHNVEQEPYFSMYCHVQFSPVDQQELSEVMTLLPVSSELLSWYSIGAPVKCYLSLFDKYSELMLADPRSLIKWQTGFRWEVQGTERSRIPEWPDSWLSIGDWGGDPVIAHTDVAGTPISMIRHDFDWVPNLIAQDLSAYILALAISIEVTMLERKSFLMELDEESYDMIYHTSVIDDLREKLRGVLDEECIDPWMWPLFADTL